MRTICGAYILQENDGVVSKQYGTHVTVASSSMHFQIAHNACIVGKPNCVDQTYQIGKETLWVAKKKRAAYSLIVGIGVAGDWKVLYE